MYQRIWEQSRQGFFKKFNDKIPNNNLKNRTMMLHRRWYTNDKKSTKCSTITYEGNWKSNSQRLSTAYQLKWLKLI